MVRPETSTLPEPVPMPFSNAIAAGSVMAGTGVTRQGGPAGVRGAIPVSSRAGVGGKPKKAIEPHTRTKATAVKRRIVRRNFRSY